jgi:hypothetical protein
MAKSIERPVGIDRCPGALHTLFALTLIELGAFEWRRATDHEWEVGRWRGLQLTLLAQPQWRQEQLPFAICPLPGSDGGVPFIMLVAFGDGIDHSYLCTGDTSLSISTLTRVEVQRDVTICAHQVFDAALWLQLPHLEARYKRLSRSNLPFLPCMKSMAEIQYRFTAPAAAINIAGLPNHPIL